jgi:serine/threonine protein kinase/tetratricopeptide (TPR) repeat protein
MDFDLPEVLTAGVVAPRRLARKGSPGISSELLRVFTWLCCRIYSSKTRQVRVVDAIEASAGEPSAGVALERGASAEETAEQTLTVLLQRRSVRVRLQESHMPDEGRRFGRYQIAETLGAGGMGDVYRARDLQLGRDVAVKFLPDRFALDAGRLARFDREARAASSLNHPNIVTVHEVGELDGVPYIVMERVEGRTLREVLAERPLALRAVLDIASQIADGLAKAHGAGIVHRDLKPDNVMVNADGYVKILDFGLAKLSDDSSDGLVSSASTTTSTDPLVHTPDTEAGGILGTVGYMSPEQAAGRKADFRSDQFSLGVILYEMLTGRRAFQRASHPQTLAAIIESEPEPVEKYNPGVPAPVRWILERCLAKRPEDRYASTLDLARELQVVREHLPESLQIFSGPWAQRPGFRGRKLGVALGAAAVVAIGLVFLSRSLLPRTPARSSDAKRPVVAILPFANVSSDPSLDYLGVGIADILITHLASLPGLTVVSRSATLPYQGQLQVTKKIAADLGAALLINGAVHRSDSKLLVTVNLVRPDDSVAWGRDYEAKMEDLFPLQRRLAEGLSAALQVTLTAADRERLARPPTTDVNAFADYSRARALLERPDVKGNVGRAIEAFQAAIQKDPRFALAHAGLGEAYWALYQETKDAEAPSRASDAITEALRLDPGEPRTRFALALVYKGTGRADPAIEELQRVLTLQPNDDDAHRLLGDILFDRGRSDEAIAEFQKGIQLRPNYSPNHSHLGGVYFHTGRFMEAAAAYRRITELQPDNSRGFQMLGATYQAMGDKRQAIENYQMALALGPDARAYSNLGSVYYSEGKYAEAARAYEEAAKLEPSAVKYRNLGDAYHRMGQHDRASDSYRRAVALSEDQLRVNPRDAEVLGMLAVSEAKLGRRAEARRHAAEAVSLRPSDAGVLYHKAVVHALAGEQKEALVALEEALGRGYSVALAREDDDLATLGSVPAFQRLMKASR